jgi:hypothetical protein
MIPLDFARVLIASVLVTSAAQADSLPHFSDNLKGRYHVLYKQFRDQIIFQGKCKAYEDAEAPIREEADNHLPLNWTPEIGAAMAKALDDCWLKFIKNEALYAHWLKVIDPHKRLKRISPHL